MTKSRRKKTADSNSKGIEKKFLLISLIVTLLLIVIIYMGFKG